MLTILLACTLSAAVPEHGQLWDVRLPGPS